MLGNIREALSPTYNLGFWVVDNVRGFGVVGIVRGIVVVGKVVWRDIMSNIVNLWGSKECLSY